MIVFEDLSDSVSTASVKKTYDFNINVVGASIRQGDFLKLSSGSRFSPVTSRSRRHRVRVFDITKYTDVLSAPVRRLPVMSAPLEDLPEARKENEDETENPISDTCLGFLEEDSSCHQSDLSCASKENANTHTPATSNPNGVFMKSFCTNPRLERSAVVHFRGKHHRSRAASYRITTGTLTERGGCNIQPLSISLKDSRWAPKNGMVIIKVFIPSTDDIWAAYFPTNVTLSAFRCRWLSKLGVHLRFSGSAMDTPEYYFNDDEFQYWIRHRVRHGRNLPIVGHLDYAVPLQKEA
jgi:hypothetical protein